MTFVLDEIAVMLERDQLNNGKEGLVDKGFFLSYIKYLFSYDCVLI